MTNPAKESLFQSLVEPAVQGLKELFLAGQTGFDALPQDIKQEMALDYSAELRLNLSTFFPVPFIPVYLKLLFMI